MKRITKHECEGHGSTGHECEGHGSTEHEWENILHLLIDTVSFGNRHIQMEESEKSGSLFPNST